MDILIITILLLACSISVIGEAGSEFCPPNSVQEEEMFTINGKCYHLIQNTNTNTGYQAASDDCQSRQGHLLTVKDEVTNDQLLEKVPHISDSHTVLLGLRKQQERWTWVTGEAAHYTNWADSNSANSKGSGECATMQLQNGGLWQQEDCAADNWYMVYICEHGAKTGGSGSFHIKHSVITVVSTALMVVLCFSLQ